VKPLVFNATPLIYLTKIGLSKIFEQLKNERLTSPRVKKEVVDEGVITKEKAKQAADEMVFAGWRCSIETYAKIMEAIEKLGKSRQ